MIYFIRAVARWTGLLALSISFLALNGCSSNSEPPIQTGFTNPNTNNTTQSPWTRGLFEPPERYEHLCANPRSGTYPDGTAYPDRQGTAMDEKLWLRSMMHYYYLWSDEMPDPNPETYSLPHYFYDALRVDGDEFSQLTSEAEYHAEFVEGIGVNYGVHWVFDLGESGLEIYAGLVHTGSANRDLIQRGDRVIAVNDVDLNALSLDSYLEIARALYPSTAGDTHNFTLARPNGETAANVLLTASPVEKDIIAAHNLIETDSGTVAYLMLDTFHQHAQSELIKAMDELVDANISDLILDLRYNSGGSLDLASELGFMVAGSEATNERLFVQYTGNEYFNKLRDEQSVEGAKLYFHRHQFDFDAGEPNESAPLNSLNLPRLFVLTSRDSCSASEALINALRGIHVPVIQVGGTTCGKPYAYRPYSNCGTTYHFQQFRFANDAGYGDYVRGFTPADDPALVSNDSPPGCTVRENFTHPLGDEEEIMLATVLHYRATGSCPTSMGQETEITPQSQSGEHFFSRSIGRAELRARGAILFH